MNLESIRGLTIPGYTGSGSGHWQTIWEQTLSNLIRVEQEDWDRPSRLHWTRALDKGVQGVGSSLVLVGHSLGCATVVHWAEAKKRTEHILGAMLVAPADVDRPGWPIDVSSFCPMPMISLPFPSVVVASSNDEWVTIERAKQFAASWGSSFVDVGEKGHLNTQSELADWPEGLMLLQGYLSRWQDVR